MVRGMVRKMSEQEKVIIPVSPNYIVNKIGLNRAFQLSFTGISGIDQTKTLIGGLGALSIAGSAIGLPLPGWIGSMGAFAYLYMKYAGTHQRLIENSLKVKHNIRKWRGHTKINNVNSPKHLIYPAQELGLKDRLLDAFGFGVTSLYSYDFEILKNGIIRFSKDKYGIIIDCQTKTISDDDLDQQLDSVRRFLNSMQVLHKFKVSSFVPYMNKVEKAVIPQINRSKNAQEKALLYSMHDLSAAAPKSPQWNVKLFLVLQSNPKEIEQYANTIIPGVLDRLKVANTTATVLTKYDQIMSLYASDLTGKIVPNSGTPALFNQKSLWKDRLRQIMAGSIVEHSDHIVVNSEEFISCVIAGQPSGVAGFPPSINSEILTQLYRLSASADHSIKIDLSVHPIQSQEALKNVKNAINRILGNTVMSEGSMVATMDMGLDIDSLKGLYIGLKNGSVNMFDINFVISVYAGSKEKLEVGVSKVKAILGANNTASNQPGIIVMRSRGTLSALAAVQNGDWIASYIGAGYDGTSRQTSAGL